MLGLRTAVKRSSTSFPSSSLGNEMNDVDESILFKKNNSFSPISWYPIGSISLVPLLQLLYRYWRVEGRDP